MEQDRLREVLRLLRPQDAFGVKKVRLGGKGDGGYVVLDDFIGIETVIGCGVGWDVSFERTFAERGIPVQLYDHTVEKPPHDHRNFNFHRRRVSAVRAADAETLDSIAAAYPTPPLRTLLKMDIEGNEWPIFAAAADKTLRSYRQIVCELHHLGRRSEPQWLDDAGQALRNLVRNFAVVHVHANNCGARTQLDGKTVPGALEVTFANRLCYATAASSRSFPTEIDLPNNPTVPDIALGHFVF
jgi:hypothetical protein